MPSTVTEVFGEEAVDALARWAIDVACDPPVVIETPSVRLSGARIEEVRAILTRVGIDWQRLKAITPPGSQGVVSRALLGDADQETS